MAAIDKRALVNTLITLLVLVWFTIAISYLLAHHNSKNGVAQSGVNKVDTTYLIKHDTIPVFIKGKDLVSVEVDSFYYPNQNITIDTGAVINRYLSCYASSYTYLKDSLYKLVVTDSICRGSLLDRQITITRLKSDSVMVIEKSTTKNATGIYAGASLSQKLTLIPTLNLVRPKAAYSIGLSPVTREVYLGFQYKIK